ncbi:MAG: hypothetical protein JXQ96_13855 [Cyclobacteriaceae bacterium]
MKKNLLFLALVPWIAFAQDPPKTTKKIYKNSEGKLYWQGEKPMYIFVADNPEGTNAQQLQSENQSQWTNPMYLDTEGVNYIRSNWAADSDLKQIQPKKELMFEVYRDSKAPVTTVAFEGAPKYKNNEGSQFYGKNLTVVSHSADIHSGVQSIFYSIDGKSFQSYSNKLSIDQDKRYDVKFYAADNVGNVEPIQMFDFRVDLTAPATDYKIHGDQIGMVFSPRTYLTLSSQDDASGVSKIIYRIDEGKEARFVDKVGLSSLKDGYHKISYYAVDNVKNQEVPKLIEFYLDSTAPVSDANVVGEQYSANNGKLYISRDSKVSLTANDNKAGVQEIKYSIDGGSPEAYDVNFKLDRASGNHIVKYFASDKVNNNISGQISKTLSVDIDLTAPTIKYHLIGNQYFSRDTTFITSDTNIKLTAWDGESGVKSISYNLNNGSSTPYDEPFSIHAEGVFVLKYNGTDNVNNVATKELVLVVDNTGPVINDVLSMAPIGKISLDEKQGNPISVYSKGVKLFLAASDAVVDADRIYYTLDNGAKVEYKSPVVINRKGLITYQVNAIDKLKNTNSSQLVEIFIK